MSSLFRRGRSKKRDKKLAKEPPIAPSGANTATTGNRGKANGNVGTDGDPDDVKEVLNLFNRLEELVVDGDPRVKEALNQKPGIQNMLREDSYSMISPRSFRPREPIVPSLPIKEPTDTSLLSFNRQPRGYGGYGGYYDNYSQLQPQRFVVPLQNTTFPYQQQQPFQQQPPNQQQIISPRRQVVVPPIRIPERTVYAEDSFYQQQPTNDGQLTGRVRRHPDGTVVATIDSIIPPQPQRPIPTQPLFSPARRREASNVYQLQQARHQQQPQGGAQGGRQNQRRRGNDGGDPVENDPYHDFNYHDKDGQTSVRIVLDQNRQDGHTKLQQRNKNKRNGDKQQKKQSRNKNDDKQKNDGGGAAPVTYVIEPSQQKPDVPGVFAYRTAAMVSKGTGSTSKVIGPEGGRLNYLGCSVDVPKNALKDKTLFRLMILDSGQIPHTTDRLYQPLGDKDPTRMPITPAVRIDPANVSLEKAITVKLPTCVAEYGQGIESSGIVTNRTIKAEQDIKTDDIEIKLRGPATNELWDIHDTEVFRSADSVTFKLRDLGDVCAFHHETNEKERKALNKRLSVYLFKSSDNRKHQFLSILLAEDLPHVIQKAVESVPHWLSYTDSCFNIILPEGKNFVVYIEPVDRSLCFTEANVMEIPWQNLWYPETIIRKHVQVTMLNRDTPAEVQLILDEGNIRFNTAFIWQVPDRSILLPDLLSSAVESDAANDKWETESQEKYLANDAYKSVKWKPLTPDDNMVTNKGILDYADM